MNAIGEPCVHHVFEGYNTCMFAYGQTGSGKTYSVMGAPDSPGLIPRMCQAMFTELEEQRADDLEHAAPGGGRS